MPFNKKRFYSKDVHSFTIYCIANHLDGTCYIGLSRQPEKRIKQHIRGAFRGYNAEASINVLRHIENEDFHPLITRLSTVECSEGQASCYERAWKYIAKLNGWSVIGLDGAIPPEPSDAEYESAKSIFLSDWRTQKQLGNGSASAARKILAQARDTVCLSTAYSNQNDWPIKSRDQINEEQMESGYWCEYINGKRDKNYKKDTLTKL